MGNAYEEIMTSVTEKNLRQQNLMILKSEALNFGRKNNMGNLVFLEYQKESADGWNATV